MSELIGKCLGVYRVEERIGAGGMAAVYKAYHEAMARYVAVKVLPEDVGADEERRLRFEREARVIAGLEHAHILPVYDYGQADDRLYLVMRYVDTGTLKDRMDSGALSMDEINRVMRQVGMALEYAHQRGVIHRDIKPSNVLLDDQGDCYLTDFGLARMLSASVKITKSGVGVGTPAYMSPEQGQGQEVDVRSDVYSLGVMLYEMVTGRVPYEAETPMAVMLEHMTKPLPLPRKVNPSISPEVESVLLKALSKDPADRYGSVREMVDAFDAAVCSPWTGFLSDELAPITVPSLEPKGAASPAGRSGVKWWWITAGAGALLMICVAVSALVFGQNLLRNWVPGAARGNEATATLTTPPTTTAVAKIAQASATTRSEATSTAPPTVFPTPSPSLMPSPMPTAAPTPLSPTPTVLPINLEATLLTQLDSDPVRDIVWSPDGALLIVGTYHIWIYDARTWDEVYVIDSIQWVSDIALSPDGAMLAAASHDGVTIWEIGGWGEMLALSGSQGAESVAFSPDGTSIAAGVGSAVKIWGLPDGRELRTLPGSSGRAVAFSPDGRLLAASGGVAGQEIKLWDMATGDELAPITGHTNWVNSIDFSPDGRRLVSGATDSTVRVWDVEARRQVRAFTAHTGQVESVAFANDGRVLASASWDLTIKLWDTETGQELASLTGHTAWCQSVAFSPDGSTLASGANDRALRLWRVETGHAGGAPTPTSTP